jgi:hypothetical protein
LDYKTDGEDLHHEGEATFTAAQSYVLLVFLYVSFEFVNNGGCRGNTAQALNQMVASLRVKPWMCFIGRRAFFVTPRMHGSTL